MTTLGKNTFQRENIANTLKKSLPAPLYAVLKYSYRGISRILSLPVATFRTLRSIPDIVARKNPEFFFVPIQNF